MNTQAWHVAMVTSVDRKKGTFEVSCNKLGGKLQGMLTILPIGINLNLYDRVRILVEVGDYTKRIKMLTKSKR